MNEPSKHLNKDLVLLHLVVLVWGAAGIVGEAASLGSSGIVFYRMAIASLALFIYRKVLRRQSLALSPRLLCAALGSGAMLAFHWWCFFESIKVSTVSIGLICLSSAPFFIAFLEPLVLRKRLRVSELLLGMACMAAMILIFNFESHYQLGLIFGALSALSDTVYSIGTSRLVRRASIDSSVLAFYQMLGGCLSLCLVVVPLNPGLAWLRLASWGDFMAMLFLGLACSALAMAIYVRCLRRISTFSAVLAINMEPVYGISLALFIYGERELMSLGFYVGSGLLLSCVVVDALVRSRPMSWRRSKRA